MKDIIVVILVLFFIASCKQRYEVSLPSTQTAFLVVEGDIITNGTTKINISRTTLLEERNISFEKGADVTIESDNNSSYPLIEKDSGVYELPFASLDENAKYRLNIKTRDSREYVSSYVPAVKTPDVDTITWTRYNEGIEIYANAKDSENNTEYYRFEYDETWEFLSPYKQKMLAEIFIDPIPRVNIAYYDSVTFSKHIDSIDNCWQFRSSSKIILATTSRLSENRLYMPLVNYPKGAWEFSHLYSIHVKQYGITKEQYDFFQKMKKNTESLGTIFDAQPSELTGNFKCLTDTSEIVIGYVGATRLKEKRTFIDNKDLIGWDYAIDCATIYVPNEQTILLDTFYYFVPGYYLPLEPVFGSGDEPIAYRAARKLCVDCTLRGSNQKPSYWP